MINLLIFLEFLCAELVVARKMHKKSQQKGNQTKHSTISSDISEHLTRACNALGLSEPPSGTDVNKLFTTLFNLVSCFINFLSNLKILESLLKKKCICSLESGISMSYLPSNHHDFGSYFGDHRVPHIVPYCTVLHHILLTVEILKCSFLYYSVMSRLFTDN